MVLSSVYSTELYSGWRFVENFEIRVQSWIFCANSTFCEKHSIRAERISTFSVWHEQLQFLNACYESFP